MTGQTGWGVVTETDTYFAGTNRSDVELDLFDAPANLATNVLLGHMWPGPGMLTQLDASQVLLSFFAAHSRTAR